MNKTHMKQDTVIPINITRIIRAVDISGSETREAYQELKNQVEPKFFVELLAHTQGNKAHAARIAGLDRGTLGIKLKQHDIDIKSLVTSKQVQA